MPRTRTYNLADRQAADKAAIRDTKEYLTKKQWKAVVEIAKSGDLRSLNIGLGMAGVSGYPFHAIARTYCLDAYREWMHSGSDPEPTDEQGYPLAD